MKKTAYQVPELRDENDNIIQEGTFGKKSAFVNSTNQGAFDYLLNNLEALHDIVTGAYLVFDSKDKFPTAGDTAKIYVANDDGKAYKWNGTEYVYMGTESTQFTALDVKKLKEAAASSANAASSSQTAAETSEANAAKSQQSAASSAAAAKASETAASSSATSAASSASTATTKATEASNSATSAASSASTATTKASEAKTSATSATNSAIAAASSAADAGVSASSASTSAADAGASASSASSSAAEAEASRQAAKESAQNCSDLYAKAQVTEGKPYFFLNAEGQISIRYNLDTTEAEG